MARSAGIAPSETTLSFRAIVDGSPAAVRGLNLVGLQRRGFDETTRRALKRAYKKLFLSKKVNLAQLTEELAESELAEDVNVARLIDFIRSSERGVIR